jgi:hypothetical protein
MMSEARQVRIVSDGRPTGTHIYDESGEEMTTVESITFSFSPHEEVTAELTVMMPKVDVSALAHIEQRCPHCGQYDVEPF